MNKCGNKNIVLFFYSNLLLYSYLSSSAKPIYTSLLDIQFYNISGKILEEFIGHIPCLIYILMSLLTPWMDPGNPGKLVLIIVKIWTRPHSHLLKSIKWLIIYWKGFIKGQLSSEFDENTSMPPPKTQQFKWVSWELDPLCPNKDENRPVVYQTYSTRAAEKQFTSALQCSSETITTYYRSCKIILFYASINWSIIW